MRCRREDCRKVLDAERVERGWTLCADCLADVSRASRLRSVTYPGPRPRDPFDVLDEDLMDQYVDSRLSAWKESGRRGRA